MGKWACDEFLDANTDYLIATAERLVLCSAQPANYAGVAAVALADVAIDGSDFTKADGDTSGRKGTVAAQSGLTVDSSGTANHIALVSDSNTKLLYVTTCPDQVLATGIPADVDAWPIEIADPT